MITIISTIMALFGMFQLGLLNGGYRIFSLRKPKEEEKIINNLIYTYFAILTGLIIITALVLKVFDFAFGTNFWIIILAIGFGVVTLVTNWISVQFSAQMNFRALNLLEILSTSFSLIFLFSIPLFGLLSALLTIFSAPLLYMIIAFYNYPDLLPTGFHFNVKRYKWILSFGFIPFLAGIFVQLHSQIERWSIVSMLNTESLGRFYLPTFYATLFMMVPLSVNRLFFPPAVRNFSIGEFHLVKRVLRNYIIFNMVYIVVVVLVTFFFLEPVIKLVLPQHVFAIKWVWYIFPGLIAMLFLQPLEILFNAAIRLKPIFITYLVSVFFMVFLIYMGVAFIDFSLSLMAIIKSLVLIFIFLSLLIYYLLNKNSIWRVNTMKEKMK